MICFQDQIMVAVEVVTLFPLRKEKLPGMCLIFMIFM